MLLLILRHAKAESPLACEDYQRALTSKGLQDATALGEKLKKKNIHPDLILLSSSTRTHQTIQALLQGLDTSHTPSISLDSLYNASEETLLNAINKHTSINTLLICAHNPGITNFLNALIKKPSFISLNPCDLAILEVPIQSTIDWHSANLKNLIQSS